jgi:hypothetical protein
MKIHILMSCFMTPSDMASWYKRLVRIEYGQFLLCHDRSMRSMASRFTRFRNVLHSCLLGFQSVSRPHPRQERKKNATYIHASSGIRTLGPSVHVVEKKSLTRPLRSTLKSFVLKKCWNLLPVCTFAWNLTTIKLWGKRDNVMQWDSTCYLLLNLKLVMENPRSSFACSEAADD